MAEPEGWSPTQVQVARFKLSIDVLKTVRHFFGMTKWAVVAVFGWLSIEALAGKATILAAVFEYAAGSGMAVGLPWLAAIVMLIWVVLERGLRRRKTAEMQTHVRELETRLDPERTGSGSLPDGRTNPEDRLNHDR